VAEWVLMRLLLEHPARAPSQVAEEMGMTRGALSKLVDRLAARGLVGRAEAAGDRRFQDLALTEAGRALVPDLAALADANDEAVFGCLSPDERRALETLLKAVARRRGLAKPPVE
jgi:DNA-binding MarR family transcriptional regulator